MTVMRALLLWTLTLMLSHPPAAYAHLGSPFGDVLGALQDAKIVALVEAVEETKDTAQGARTEVRTLASFSGRLPSRLTILQPPPHVHRHRLGDVFVVPLGERVRDAYPCTLETAAPLAAGRDEAAALGALLKRWRSLPRPTPPGVRMAALLRDLERSGSTALGRRVTLELLVGHIEDARAALDAEGRRALLAAIADPGQTEAYRLGLVRAAGLMADGDVLRGLCAGLARQDSVPVRSATLDALAVTAGACFRSALDRCRADARDPLRRRCETLWGRLD